MDSRTISVSPEFTCCPTLASTLNTLPGRDAAKLPQLSEQVPLPEPELPQVLQRELLPEPELLQVQKTGPLPP